MCFAIPRLTEYFDIPIFLDPLLTCMAANQFISSSHSLISPTHAGYSFDINDIIIIRIFLSSSSSSFLLTPHPGAFYPPHFSFSLSHLSDLHLTLDSIIPSIYLYYVLSHLHNSIASFLSSSPPPLNSSHPIKPNQLIVSISSTPLHVRVSSLIPSDLFASSSPFRYV